MTTTQTDTTEVRETILEHLRPTAIVPHPKNPRTDLGDVTELAESIKGQGVLEPLIVTPAKAKGKYTLIAGHRRHAAAKRAVLKTVPCIVRFDLAGDDRAQLEVMLTENLHRSDLNVVEEGNAYQSLLEFDDVDLKGLASRTGHKQKTIRDRIKLANAPQSVRDRLVARQVTIEDALALTEFADDQPVYDRLALFLGTPNFAFNVEQARKDRDWLKREAKIVKELTDKGIRVATDDALDEEADAATDAAETDPAVVTFDWIEAQNEDEIPDGAERVALTDRNVESGYVWKYKQFFPGSGGDDTDSSGKPIKPAVETGAQAQAREERERKAKLEEDLRTAATVRRRFLAKAAAESNSDFAVRCLRLYVMDRSTRSGMTKSASMELLGVPPMTKDDDENDHAEIERHVNKMTLPQLAVSAYLLDKVMQEEHLANAFQWQREPYPALDAWHHDLTEVFGYEYSDVEQGLLDALDAATANAQE
ncbi:ParB/RepB/Spo0J family partition protein [Rhodococcus sp. 15-2388-1-1a]|uniref:ParB/RepB/Spo0J family partition protein n=1 Tax=Rhodococcus sp. 15-2388-1-1a TaxID=2023142 RepID=UPI0015955A66|nr:ParB/RepB/Spo0J family partition protein [Rhodococcus sp. 15-2388-1-1a]